MLFLPYYPDIDFLNTMLPNLIVSNGSEIINTKRFKNKNDENLDLIKILFKGALQRVFSILGIPRFLCQDFQG